MNVKLDHNHGGGKNKSREGGVSHQKSAAKTADRPGPYWKGEMNAQYDPPPADRPGPFWRPVSTIRLGLVDTTKWLDANLVQAASAALNLQITRDLPQFWSVNATMEFLPDVDRIPAGVWPILLVSQLEPGEGGFHLDRHNQPYAKVIATHQDDSWTIDASHETVEMLIDPYGNRLQSGESIYIDEQGAIQNGTGQVSYLVEACDPCEANEYGYEILGVLVSDFITPHFYDPIQVDGTRYSFSGSVTRPRQILPGGYISFLDLASEKWQQILWLDPNEKPALRGLGHVPANVGSLREWIDAGFKERLSLSRRLAVRQGTEDRAMHRSERRQALEGIAIERGRSFRKY